MMVCECSLQRLSILVARRYSGLVFPRSIAYIPRDKISKSTLRPLSHSTKTCFFPRIPFIDGTTVIEIAFGDRKWRSSRGLGF